MFDRIICFKVSEKGIISSSYDFNVVPPVPLERSNEVRITIMCEIYELTFINAQVELLPLKHRLKPCIFSDSATSLSDFNSVRTPYLPTETS